MHGWFIRLLLPGTVGTGCDSHTRVRGFVGLAASFCIRPHRGHPLNEPPHSVRNRTTLDGRECEYGTVSHS